MSDTQPANPSEIEELIDARIAQALEALRDAFAAATPGPELTTTPDKSD